MIAPPRRRRFRFSLRTMFVAVTLLAIPLGWAAYSLNWIRQRHEMLRRTDIGIVPNFYSPRLSAPGGLWLFGETGIQSLHVSAPPYLPEEVDRLHRLFPEAQIEDILFPMDGLP